MEKNIKNINEKFQQQVHFWGRLTVGLAFLCTLSIPIYLTFILGYKPNVTDVVTGLISIAGFVGVIWIVEPISYFPTLGPAGTYMSFLSGNIGNMRLPVIASTHDALEIEPGSDAAEVAGIFAIIASTITNLAILAIVMIAGQAIINVLPPTILASFDFALPGILGAMIVMLGSKVKVPNLVALVVIAVVSMVVISNSPKFLSAGLAKLIKSADVAIIAILGIVYSVVMAKKDHKE